MAAGLGVTAPNARAETRGYVISMIHTATYANEDTCPSGGNGDTVDIRTRRLLGAGFGEEAALRIIGNGGVDDDGNRVDITRLHGSSAEAGGQPWNGQPVSPGNVPALSADPGIESAQGRFAYGFDLDGEVSPDDFEDPDSHERGVDNHNVARARML